ncbi:hypothetical protein C8T65DRAFT_653493 [Cerioporus squamosus]|nr:hypothetical protein C8T65DRAFT_653493 [Cerioporus squamosus]
MSSLVDVQKKFLSSPHYAVVGASKDRSKFGTKVLKWYQARNKDVTPVHPKEDELEGLKTIQSIAELPAPTETSCDGGNFRGGRSRHKNALEREGQLYGLSIAAKNAGGVRTEHSP